MDDAGPNSLGCALLFDSASRKDGDCADGCSAVQIDNPTFPYLLKSLPGRASPRSSGEFPHTEGSSSRAITPQMSCARCRGSGP